MWKDISTAPRDGSQFLAYKPSAKKYKYLVVHYHGCFPKRPFRMVTGSYPSGLTHWMPINEVTIT